MNNGKFLLPPIVHNARGEVRKAGFELEYAGITIEQSAAIVRDVFGGDDVAESTFIHNLNTPIGWFCCEIDTSFLKDKQYESALRAVGYDPESHDTTWLEKALLGVMSTVVPIEIGTPPIPITELAPLDELRYRLHKAGAKGTRVSLFYAFGMHINPEIPSDDPVMLRDYLRAFLLLSPWMKQRADVDFSRSVTPYINPFPTEYTRTVLQPDYPADVGRIIDDYIEHNPTRNRSLDMLPVLAHFDHQRVIDRVEDKHLVKPRPAFHYRMPNCDIDNPQWSLAQEWNTWVAVERLACDSEKLARMSRDYLRADQNALRPFYDKWPDVLEGYMASAAPTVAAG